MFFAKYTWQKRELWEDNEFEMNSCDSMCILYAPNTYLFLENSALSCEMSRTLSTYVLMQEVQEQS